MNFSAYYRIYIYIYIYTKKLNNLYKCHLLLINNIDKNINPLACNLMQQQKDFLNLRSNCYLFQGYTTINKKYRN